MMFATRAMRAARATYATHSSASTPAAATAATSVLTSLAIGLTGVLGGSLAVYAGVTAADEARARDASAHGAAQTSSSTPSDAARGSASAKSAEGDEKKKKDKDKDKATVKSEAELFHAHELQKRRVHVIGRIDDRSVKSACGSLFYLNDVDDKLPIVMYLNSGGGSVTAGLALYDTMKHVSAPVYTVCVGHCESMAAILLAAGDRRFAMPNARIMIHQPSHVIERSTTSDVIIKAEKAENTRRRLAKLISDSTGQTEDTVNKAIERNTYMNAQEAKAFNVIDEVIVSQHELKNEPKKVDAP